MSDTESGLKKRLGLLSTTLVGIGGILGAGIYVLVGVAAGEAGNAVWLSCLIAAVVAGLTGISYARLSRIKPQNAPEYQYLNMAFGRFTAFIAGWLILCSVIISTAAVALGFAGYLEHWLGVPYLESAIVLIIVCSFLVFWGVKESAIAVGLLTVLEVGALVFIIAVGIPHIGEVNLLETAPAGFTGIISAACLLFFAYLGFESMANLAEEMKNPRRDLPRAIILAISITTIIYILVAVAGVSVLGWSNLSQSNSPLADVAASALGRRTDLLLIVAALASTANTVLLLLFASSRAMHAMSKERVLPGIFSSLGKRRRTPWITVIIVGILACLFTVFRNIGQIADFTNFIVLLAFAGVNVSVMKIFSGTEAGKGSKNILLNRVLPVLGCIVCLALAAYSGWKAAIFGVVVLGIGGIVYLIMNATHSSEEDRSEKTG